MEVGNDVSDELIAGSNRSFQLSSMRSLVPRFDVAP